MVLIAARCFYYQDDQGIKRGKTAKGKQRYRCHKLGYVHQSFLIGKYLSCVRQLDPIIAAKEGVEAQL